MRPKLWWMLFAQTTTLHGAPAHAGHRGPNKLVDAVHTPTPCLLGAQDSILPSLR